MHACDRPGGASPSCAPAALQEGWVIANHILVSFHVAFISSILSLPAASLFKWHVLRFVFSSADTLVSAFFMYLSFHVGIALHEMGHFLTAARLDALNQAVLRHVKERMQRVSSTPLALLPRIAGDDSPRPRLRRHARGPQLLSRRSLQPGGGGGGAAREPQHRARGPAARRWRWSRPGWSADRPGPSTPGGCSWASASSRSSTSGSPTGESTPPSAPASAWPGSRRSRSAPSPAGSRRRPHVKRRLLGGRMQQATHDAWVR